jgi:hypothetical protein
MEFNTLQDVRNFADSIPADKYIKFDRGYYSNGFPSGWKEDRKGCILGQLDFVLTERKTMSDYLLPNLTGDKLFTSKLADANNSPGDTKTNVLNFLDDYIRNSNIATISVG